MIVIIPLGGMGERFKNAGYRKPKPLINVMGKSIIYWLLDHLISFDSHKSIDHIVIPYNFELTKYNFESLLRQRYPKLPFEFVVLSNQTKGAAESVLLALEHCFELDGALGEKPVLCLDGDNFYMSDVIGNWSRTNAVNYFIDDSDSQAYSFLDLKENNVIASIIEKKRISRYACCGSYGFQSAQELKLACSKLIAGGLEQIKEYYLSCVVQLMIEKDSIFHGREVNRSDYVCLGTPFDVRLFCNNYPKINTLTGKKTIQPQRYCFDLDNTLVTFPEVYGDYATVKPIRNSIEFLRYLKKIGHTIIIYTARRMKTTGGNVGKIMAEVGLITLKTLEDFDIPYDEIYFGKPYADFYIDDLAVPAYDDLEKEMGYYKSTIDTRSFNSIVSNSINTFEKRGRDLSGEIYWYQHIPNTIKDMFPIFFRHSDNSYLMEKINGIPFSMLFLSEDLTEDHLNHIMNSLERIHQTAIPDSEDKTIDIYQNYSQKLVKRYAEYSYDRFPNAHNTYERLLNYLQQYESDDRGVRTIIHGDPVLTNIMINQFGKIKFIDMRGKLGSITTILGDCYYDWAKLYQSLIGYDEILCEKSVSASYKSKLLTCFQQRITRILGENAMETIKHLTASLLFTLIPLHDNDKCHRYYQLIDRLIN